MSEDVILGVHSNVRNGQMDPETGDPYGFDAGHAWISVTRDGKTTRYGLWPDAHPNVEDNGDGSDIRTGMEDGDTPAASRYYRLTLEQVAKLDSLLKANETWGYTHNCSSWARTSPESPVAPAKRSSIRFAQVHDYVLREEVMDARAAALTLATPRTRPSADRCRSRFRAAVPPHSSSG